MREKIVIRRKRGENHPLLLSEKWGGLGILFLLGARLLLWPSPVLELQLLAVFWLCHVCGWTFIAWGVFRHFKPNGKKI
jgi:hypothetical protein